ncbi:MAG: hypothetical protein H6828_14050 [Planctomycetes bacterium]|nr:hypothetical protein [Planctomycetota bacterium]
MLHHLLALVVAIAPALQEPAPQDPPLPTPERVAEAVEALETAFDEGGTPEKLEALEKHGDVLDAGVVTWLEKGLGDKESAVKLAAVDKLRWMEHPAALTALQKRYKRDAKKLQKEPALWEAYLWAIAQHGSADSIDLLVDGALAEEPLAVRKARIYGLGHVRAKRSVEELMDFMQKTGRGLRRGGGQPLMAEFAVSLSVLTGQDFGQDEKAWQAWWKANARDFEPTPEAAPPKKVARVWSKLWARPDPEGEGEDGEAGRGRRKKRGEDPGAGGGEGGDGAGGDEG